MIRCDRKFRPLDSDLIFWERSVEPFLFLMADVPEPFRYTWSIFMLRYRLDDLGWFQFESLMQSLMKAELGLGIES